MGKIRLSVGILAALGILTNTPSAHAPLLDLDSCHDDLDRVRRQASEASEGAEEAKSKSEEFEDCKRDPDVHDLMGDGCSSKRSDYETALSDLESKLDDLDSRLRSVQTSCGYQFTINRISDVDAAKRHLEALNRRFCDSVREFIRLGMTPDNALKLCKANADERACKACLGVK